ncbi:hypothetical protein AAE478_010077 [Parahypoxylon ruwenzoriense]
MAIFLAVSLGVCVGVGVGVGNGVGVGIIVGIVGIVVAAPPFSIGRIKEYIGLRSLRSLLRHFNIITG